MSNIGLTEAECEELRIERMADERYRLSDGKHMRGYKVYEDGSIELPSKMLANLFDMFVEDLNIDIDKYRYDRYTNRLIRIMP